MLPQDLDYAGVRLRLISSRLVDDGNGNEHGHGHGHHQTQRHGRRHGRRQGHHSHSHSDMEPVIIHEDPHRPIEGHKKRDTPIFRKNEAATNFELFFDLWFVANLNVFTSVHEIFGAAEIASFIGYIVLLWTTWLMVTIYDVRFTSDSVFERCCRAIHLGVMVGFAEFGTSFEPHNQIKAIFRTLSLFLAASRFTLAFQYGVVAWKIRKYADGKRPVITTAVLHFIAAAIYFGISFRYDDGKNSRVYIMWYITGTVEMMLHLSFSNLSKVLSFVGTHFGERLNLLTLIILGEGCIILAKNITLLVKDTFLKDVGARWSGALIGSVTSAAALVYIIFQLYFDWLHEGHHSSMFEAHQVWWASIHLPFHVALVLFLEGAMQFVSYGRILETIHMSMKKLEEAAVFLEDSPTSEEVSSGLANIIYPFLEKYPPPNILETYENVKETLGHIAEIDNDFWEDYDQNIDDPAYEEWVNDIAELYSTMINSVYYAFGIEQPEEDDIMHSGHSEHVEQETTDAISKRFELIFLYCFACAGIVLLMLTIMHTLSKRKGWTPFNVARTAICFAIAVGLSLLCILTVNPDYRTTFMGSPWMLPTIALSYFSVLVLTHLPHPQRFGLGRFAAKEYRGVTGGEHKDRDEEKARELLPTTRKEDAPRPHPRERIYSRSRSRSPTDDDEDEDQHGDHHHHLHDRDAPRRSLRRAQRRERTGSTRHGEKDRAHHRGAEEGFGAFDDRRVTLLSEDAERMMSPSPSPPTSPNARARDHRRDYH